MKSILKAIGIIAFTAIVLGAFAQTTFINFDDGTVNTAVGNFYSSNGVTFSNAVWVYNYVGTSYCQKQATSPLCITSGSSGPFNSVTNPVIATFTLPQQQVSMLGFNVGFAGVRMDAYDSVTGGTLVASSQQFGITSKGEYLTGSCPQGAISEEYLLQVSAPTILRIELYRPNPIADDGVYWDNLSFLTCSGGCPPLSATNSQPDEILLSWPTCPGSSYQVEYSWNLNPSAWTPLYPTNILGTGGVVSFSEHTSETQRFYRLRCR